MKNRNHSQDGDKRTKPNTSLGDQLILMTVIIIFMGIIRRYLAKQRVQIKSNDYHLSSYLNSGTLNLMNSEIQETTRLMNEKYGESKWENTPSLL